MVKRDYSAATCASRTASAGFIPSVRIETTQATACGAVESSVISDGTRLFCDSSKTRGSETGRGNADHDCAAGGREGSVISDGTPPVVSLLKHLVKVQRGCSKGESAGG